MKMKNQIDGSQTLVPGPQPSTLPN